MKNIAAEITSKMQSLRDKNGQPISWGNLDPVIKDFTELFQTCVRESNGGMFKEIQGIGNKIQETRQDMASHGDDSMVADATMELDAVVKSTEEATNKILDAAERIQSLMAGCSDKTLSGNVLNDITMIFEACNFQDLTGQRIKKVTSTLEFIEQSVGGILAAYAAEGAFASKDKRADASLMAGPQADTDKPSQDDVDSLFGSV